jgi:hypothetical protein
MTEQTQITLLVIGLFVVVFPMFWCSIVMLLSFVGGWRNLAEKYATDKEPKGHAFRWVNGSVGVVSYKNCLTAHVAPEGLFLSVPIFFRIGHKPLFIPWKAIHSQQSSTFLWYKAVRFEVGQPTIARVQLPAKVMDARAAAR